MGEWLNLHTELANALGDPRTSDGSLIGVATDGVRYSANFRALVLSDSIKWVIPILLPITPDIPLSLITEETLTYSNGLTATNSILKLLLVEGNDTPKTVIPVIRKSSKMAKTKHTHWAVTPFAYLTDKTKIKIVNVGTRTSFDITYIKDFASFTSSTTDGTDIYIPSAWYQYVIARAVHIVKINEQRYKEATDLKNDALNEMISLNGGTNGNSKTR